MNPVLHHTQSVRPLTTPAEKESLPMSPTSAPPSFTVSSRRVCRAAALHQLTTVITTMLFTVVLLEHGLDPAAAAGLGLGILAGAPRASRTGIVGRDAIEVVPVARS
ncbi:hypothetical protein [Amycolatopsis sp. NPDC051071]|uniref:hypothetical protein n=1 Tax=Amycolatopsis sp. NPDC051071 TaxID=3154637 RepID=UPI00343ECA2C